MSDKPPSHFLVMLPGSLNMISFSKMTEKNDLKKLKYFLDCLSCCDI